MTSEFLIREECPADTDAIGELITSAFFGMPYADGDEAELVEALRSQDALSVSLVAQLDDAIVGHIAFSPARTAGGIPGWYALGPVAVLPARQGTGIGSMLVHAGLEAVSRIGAVGCILTGSPDFYSRFGFEPAPESAPSSEPSEFFMVKLFGGSLPAGSIRFHEAFDSAV
jgi:putative acetyltransferase